MIIANAAEAMRTDVEPDEACRAEALTYTLDNMPGMVMELARDGLPPVSELTYPLMPETVTKRIGMVAVERSLTLMPNDQVSALLLMYRDAPAVVYNPKETLKAYGAEYYLVRHDFVASEPRLLEEAQKAIRGQADYARINRLGANILSYAQRAGLSLPMLASLSDVESLVDADCPPEDAIIRRYYGFGKGGRRELMSDKIARSYGYSTAPVAIKAIRNRLDSRRRQRPSSNDVTASSENVG